MCVCVGIGVPRSNVLSHLHCEQPPLIRVNHRHLQPKLPFIGSNQAVESVVIQHQVGVGAPGVDGKSAAKNN